MVSDKVVDGKGLNAWDEAAAAPNGSLTQNSLATTSLTLDQKSLPEHARLHNRTMLIRTLYRDGPLSRADLARSSQLTKVSVSEVISDLLAANLVKEAGTRPGSRRG